MNAEILLQHFETVSEAPDAVSQLRRLILDLAVRGKLVEQDPSDEPALDLLRQIEAEKLRRVNKGLLKKQKPLAPIEESERPFEVPSNWLWTPIRSITADRGQKVPSQTFTYIDVSAIDKQRGVVAHPQILTPEEAPSRARKVVKKGDVLYSCVRPYLLNIAVVDDEFTPEPIVSTAFAVLDGFGLIEPHYLWLALRTSYFIAYVEEKMRGQAYPAINDADFAPLPFPLPPLAEQYRIVAKVNELMALCNDLEAAREQREKRRDTLVATALRRLSLGDLDDKAAAAHSFDEDVRFYLENLTHLVSRPEHVRQLRQTLLILAMRGKLVRQEPSDEPAVRLLERINEERQRQISNGTLKKQELLPEIDAGEMAFRLPDSWRWVALQNLLRGDTQNGSSAKPDEAPNGIPILRISAGTVRTDGIVAEEEFKLISGVDPITRNKFNLERGDLLACRFNGNKYFVGRMSVFNDYSGINPIYPDKLIRIRLFNELYLPELLRYFANSEVTRKVIDSYCATTVGNWGISASNLKKIPLPIPPLAEQHRIVAKLDQLMLICDHLEAQLASSVEKRTNLLKSVLAQSLMGEADQELLSLAV